MKSGQSVGAARRGCSVVANLREVREARVEVPAQSHEWKEQ